MIRLYFKGILRRDVGTDGANVRESMRCISSASLGQEGECRGKKDEERGRLTVYDLRFGVSSVPFQIPRLFL